MTVSTQLISKAGSDQQQEVANRVASLRSGEWIHEPLLADNQFWLATDSADRIIEGRVLGQSGIRINHCDSISPSISRYHLEQEFEGVVLMVDVKRRVFLSRLVDETNPSVPDEEALMSFNEISPDDHDLIVPGALFSWFMGRTERNRMVERNSEIRFRRMFKFSESSIERAKNSAAAMYNLLSDEV